MDKTTFLRLLTEEVKTYRAVLETEDSEWIVKGFIDVGRNIYTMTNDTKVVSKILELILIPRLEAFAGRYGLVLELPSAQNFYPDLTFKDEDGHLFAVDFKSSYYGDNNRVNGLTLGSYWGYFRNRGVKKNTDYPYKDYQCHLVIGMLYRQSPSLQGERTVYQLDELDRIKSVIEQFVFFVQPKWKIASDRTGSENTRNIGGVVEIDRLVEGTGPFAGLGEEVFDHYWMNFFNAADAAKAGIGKPRYHNLETYKNYLDAERRILTKWGK